MKGWLIDTPLLNWLASTKTATLQKWCDANNPSLFLTSNQVYEISCSINKTPGALSERAAANDEWLMALVSQFSDRILVVDSATEIEVGALSPYLANVLPRYRRDMAVLVALARAYGHGLITRRADAFSPWAKVSIKAI